MEPPTPSPPATPPNSPGKPAGGRGPAYMILAGGMFTVMVGLVKVARQELSALDLVLWRTLAAVPLALLLAGAKVRTLHRRGLLLMRAALGFASMVCFFTAAKGLSLSDLAILTKLQPILVVLIAPVLLGQAERLRTRIWGLVLCGFVGCALIVGPDLQIGAIWGLWALAATFSSAGAHVVVRKLGQSEHPEAVVFWFQVVVAGLALVAILVTTGALPAVPPAHLWPHVLGCGVFATLGQTLMTRAYTLERAGVIAAASYTTPLFALIGDIVVFALVPDAMTLFGGLLVIGAGLVLVFRSEAVAGRAGR